MRCQRTGLHRLPLLLVCGSLQAHASSDTRCYHSSVRDTVFSSLNGSVHRNTLQTTEGGDVPSVLGQIL